MDAPKPSTLKRIAGARPSRFLRIVVLKWIDDNILRLSAGLAFYAVFSLAPLLVIVLHIAGWAVGDDTVRAQVTHQVQEMMGDKPANVVFDMIKGTYHPRKSLIATYIGVFSVLFGATSLFAELQHSLNVIWRQDDQKPRGGIINWIQGRLISAGMVLAILILLLASLVFAALMSAASNFMAEHLHVSFSAWGLMGFSVALVGEILLFALIFKALPHVRMKWGDVWWGAIVTAVLFEAGKWVVGWYLGSGLVGDYGATGSVVLLLLWVYYSAIIVLTGAVLTQVRARRIV